MRQLGAFADTFVVDVLDALQIERAHLAATSFGGYTALHAVAAHPGRVDRFNKRYARGGAAAKAEAPA